MLIGIVGNMGGGKTVTMSMLMKLLELKTHSPLAGTYHLKGAQFVDNTNDLWNFQKGAFGFDEIWISVDSRASTSKINRFISQWVNQTRKKQLIFFYTTQTLDQVDLRIRNATNVLIYVEHARGYFTLSFIDNLSKRVFRRLKVEERYMRPFYSVYDTFEVVRPLIVNGYGDDPKEQLSDDVLEVRRISTAESGSDRPNDTKEQESQIQAPVGAM